MMRIILYFFISAIWITQNCATILNGRIITSSVVDSIADISIQINTNTGTDDLGGATIILNYDTTAFSIPDSLASNVDYIFHNFSGGNYAHAFITKPFPNELWINIELDTSNQGTQVSGLGSWTDLVTLKMKLLSYQSIGAISFNTASPFWAVFDEDNSTLWESGLFDQISKSDDQIVIPSEFNLFQNYPNPFNPETKIRFSLQIESVVKLAVYNLLGELVQELINGKIAAGVHEVTFGGNNLSSGIYIYRIEAVNYFIASRKMTLLK